MDRQEFVNAARGCVGVRFKHQGRTKYSGLDCVGLVRHALVELNETEDDFTAYTLFDSGADLRRMLSIYFEELPLDLDNLQPGNVLLFNVDGQARHLAIYTERNTIIHALAKGPLKVVEHGFRHPWPSMVVGVYDWRGPVEDDC